MCVLEPSSIGGKASAALPIVTCALHVINSNENVIQCFDGMEAPPPTAITGITCGLHVHVRTHVTSSLAAPQHAGLKQSASRSLTNAHENPARQRIGSLRQALLKAVSSRPGLSQPMRGDSRVVRVRFVRVVLNDAAFQSSTQHAPQMLTSRRSDECKSLLYSSEIQHLNRNLRANYFPMEAEDRFL